MASCKDFEAPEALLEEGPTEEFRGAKLFIQPEMMDGSRPPSSLAGDMDSVAKLCISPDSRDFAPLHTNVIQNDDELAPIVSSGVDYNIRDLSAGKKENTKPEQNKATARTDVICPNPAMAHDNARNFFTYRDGIVENAVSECYNNLISREIDGEYIGSWLLTEISLWDNDKERLILLSSRMLTIVKYDFIALKMLDHRKIDLEMVDTLVIGELVYPTGSLIPRLSGLATGVVTVVKGCLLKPLQERWTRSSPIDKDFHTSSLDFNSFEPRARNMNGLRAMWNKGEQLSFSKKWNPFSKDIPLLTFTSHPLLWHKDISYKHMFDIEDFSRRLVMAVEHAQEIAAESLVPCRIEHKPIILQNYVGLSSIIHNRNDLGYFKVRGKFSF